MIKVRSNFPKGPGSGGVGGFAGLRAAGALLLALFAAPAAAQPAGSGTTEVLSAPAPDLSGRRLAITLRLPQGAGPFPLAIVNHGSPPSPADRPKMNPVFATISDWFLGRGYAVALPTRRGYGTVGGEWDEGFGDCDRPDFVKAGIKTANDIEAALATLLASPAIAKRGVIVVGQSAGGWGTIALAARPHPEIAGLINFAGGRGGHRNQQPNTNCNPDRLIAAAGRFGQGAKTPMVWIYTENDTFFGPPLAQAMHKAFVGAGGNATLRMLPAFEDDGHELMARRTGLPVWAPIVDEFLKSVAGEGATLRQR